TCRLRAVWPDEEAFLAMRRREGTQPALNGAIQLAHRQEVLRDGYQLGASRLLEPRPDDRELRRVLCLHALGPFGKDEMAQGMLTKRHERKLYLGRIVASALGEVRAAKVGHTADGSQQIACLRQMEHLLHRDAGDDTLPALDSLQLLRG